MEDDEEDPKQSTRRRQPELGEGTVEKKEPMENEFAPDPTDEFDDIAPRNNRMNDLMRGVARQASLDRGDELEL